MARVKKAAARTSPSAPPAGRRVVWVWIAGAIVAAAYVALAAFHVARGALNVDEGFYAAASRAVWQGEVPYRDFGFTQPPLVAYVNAPALGLTRFGLFEQRAVNGVWGALALLLAARLVRRRAGAGWAVLLVAIFALTPAWLYFIQLGKTYALTSLMAMAMTTAYLEMKPGGGKSIALAVISVLGVACRLPVAPFFGALWLAALWDAGRPGLREVAVAVGALIAATAAVFLPFYLAAPEQTLFWVFDFHRISVPMRDWRLQWNDFLGLAPAVWCATVLMLYFRARARLGWKQPEVAVAVAAFVGLAANLLPRGAYEEYGVPFLPPLAAATLILLAPAVSGSPAPRRVGAAVVLLVLSLAAIPAINWSRLAAAQRQFPSVFLPVNVPPFDYGLARALEMGRETVRRLLPAGEPFVGPAILLAVEADRPIPRQFRMGAFGCTADFDPDTADRLHLATLADFERQLRDIDVPMVGLHGEPKFNYGWSVPSLAIQPLDARQAVHALVQRYFVLVHADREFVIVARPHVLSAAQRAAAGNNREP